MHCHLQVDSALAAADKIRRSVYRQDIHTADGDVHISRGAAANAADANINRAAGGASGKSKIELTVRIG